MKHDLCWIKRLDHVWWPPKQIELRDMFMKIPDQPILIMFHNVVKGKIIIVNNTKKIFVAS